LVQAFLKKWWVESDCKAPNLPLSLRLKGSLKQHIQQHRNKPANHKICSAKPMLLMYHFNEYSFIAVTEQMNINISALVLESDGTEVDDDELLKRFGEDHIYMALSEGQNWSAAHSVAHDKSRQEAEVIEETKTSTFNENVETGKKIEAGLYINSL
jgi:hypothetical protein